MTKSGPRVKVGATLSPEVIAVALSKDADRAATSRVFTWAHDLHSDNSDMRNDSPLTLRSDGTGHFKAFIDSNATWEFWFDLFRVNGEHIHHLPDIFGSGTERFHLDKDHREVEFTWRVPEILNSIATIVLSGQVV